MYLDDYVRLKYPRGIVVNGSIMAENLDYYPDDEIEYLLGTTYIPIRRQFWEYPVKKIQQEITSVLITFGGTDEKNFTKRVLHILGTEWPDINKYVFMNDLMKSNLLTKEILLSSDPDIDAIIETMIKVDLAISASGQTLYELACIGVPVIAVQTAENQRINFENWIQAEYIDGLNQFSSTKILLRQ